MKRVSELHSISCFRLNEVAWLKKQIIDIYVDIELNIEFVRKGNKVTGFELSVGRAGHIVFVRK